jgi:predicted alpha/beta-fold hydrolase
MMAAMEQGQDTCSMEQGQDISNIKLLLLDGARGAPAGNADCPTHLVVLMHGVMGRSSHMRALGEAAQRRLGSGALIFSTSSYARLGSLRGTRFAGSAVFAEIEAIVQRHKTLTHITLCGYSFGGIVAIWVAGRLHETAFLGLSPVNFITVACPHLGVSEPTGGGLLQVMRTQEVC